jgi:hypothetical protein
MNLVPLALTTILLLGPSLKLLSPDLANCRSWQQSQGIAAELAAMGPPPTRIRIMPARYRDLVNSEAGLEKTHVLGVELDNGRVSTTIDDLGLYLIVPWLALKLGLPLNTSYDLFIVLLSAASFISGVSGFLRLTSALWPRLVATTALALVSILAAVRVGDVYVAMGALPVALVPWILVAARRRSLPLFLEVGAIAGAMAATANVVRSQSGTSLLLFLVVAWALGANVPARIRLAGVGAAFLGLGLGWAAFRTVVAKRDALLAAQGVNSLLLRHGHPFWHSVYVGLGYVRNDAVPEYRDEVGIAKVCSMDPRAGFVSTEYERDLRSATWQLARARPTLVIHNLLAKAAVILFYVLVFGNIGWIALFRRPLALEVDLAFLVAMAFDSLFGLLVAPYLGYLFGMISYAALFGAVSFMLAAESGGRASIVSNEVR